MSFRSAPNTRRPRPSRHNLDAIDVSAEGGPAEPLPWPSQLKERAQALRTVVTHADGPLTVEQVAQHFHRARCSDVRDLLDTLAALGHVEATGEGAYAA